MGVWQRRNRHLRSTGGLQVMASSVSCKVSVVNRRNDGDGARASGVGVAEMVDEILELVGLETDPR